jgi:hypothetical protein
MIVLPSIPLLLSLFTVQGIASQFIPERKRQMWIMCAPMSLFFSVIGAIQSAHLLTTGSVAATPFMDFVMDALITYFYAELMWIGTLYFNDTVLLEFWIHHIVYILLLSFIKENGYSGLPPAFLVVEIPTCVRAIGTLFPAYRSDTLFNATFITFRIVWPLVPTLLIQPPNVYFYIIPIMMESAHLYWLYLLVTRPPKNLTNE